MPTFRYTAVDTAGKRVHGTVEAASASAVADRLHGKRHVLLRAVEVGGGGGRSVWEFLQADLSFRRGLPQTTVAHFTREMSVMLHAGQDVDHALRFLVETSDNKRALAVLRDLRDHVRGGKSLTAALSEHPAEFSRLYISLVRAGEAGGKLAQSLGQLAELLERENRLAATIQSALIYPALLATASLGTVVLLLTYVLPQFTPIFAQAGAQLPVATRLLLGTGEVVRNYGLAILVAVLALILIAYRALREPKIRLTAERYVLLLPIVGTLVRRVQAARLTRTLGTLLSSGVSLVAALGIGRDVLGSRMAVNIVDSAVSKVKAGETLASALAAGGFFPIQTIHLLRLGEETGRLADMAGRAADVHDEQVHTSIQRLVSLLVPIVTIFMGLVVAGIVGSLLVAMLSLNDIAI